MNPNSTKHQNRQVKAFYIAPTEEKFKAVLDYIETSTERIKFLKVIKYSKDTKRLTLVDESLSANKKKITQLVSSCDFASAK